MVYVICFPIRKCSRDVQTWTLTSLICCSSGSLNNPPSVFLGEKSCNQILIPEAQTRWWKLKSWRSLGFFSHLCFSLFSPSQCVSSVLLLLFSVSLCSHLSSCPPPSSIWLMVVYSVRKPGKMTWSLGRKPRKVLKKEKRECKEREVMVVLVQGGGPAFP